MRFLLLVAVLLVIGLATAMVMLGRRSRRGSGPESLEAGHSRTLAPGIRDSQNQAGGL